MSKRLCVRNLNRTITEESLKSLFSEVGLVESVEIVKEKGMDFAEGHGYIEMASEAEAEDAIQKLNDSSFEGRPIIVEEAEPKMPWEEDLWDRD